MSLHDTTAACSLPFDFMCGALLSVLVFVIAHILVFLPSKTVKRKETKFMFSIQN